MEKQCSKCKQIKPYSDFNPSKRMSCGYSSWCKECHNLDRRNRGTTQEQKDDRNAKARAWRKANPQLQSDRQKSNRLRHPEKILLYSAKARAKARGLPFDLTLDDIVIPEFCPILGIRLVPGGPPCADNLASIDRVKPALGYVKNNIVVISHRANRIKYDATIEEIRAIERYLTEAYESQSNKDA